MPDSVEEAPRSAHYDIHSFTSQGDMVFVDANRYRELLKAFRNTLKNYEHISIGCKQGATEGEIQKYSTAMDHLDKRMGKYHKILDHGKFMKHCSSFSNQKAFWSGSGKTPFHS